MGGLVWRAMDADAEPAVELLTAAEFASPITSVKKQLAAAKSMANCQLQLPSWVTVRTTVAELRSLLLKPAVTTALTVLGAPPDVQVRLDALRAVIEVQHDPAAALSAASAHTMPESDRGGYRLGAARAVAPPPPSARELRRLTKLWQAGSHALANGGGSADDAGLPEPVRLFLEDSAMYGRSHRSCCAFHCNQRLRMLAFLHFFEMDGSDSGGEVRREVEWYAACDEVSS